MKIGVDYVFVDATHISESSRKKVLKRLHPDHSTDLKFIELECPLQVALIRNATRSGLKKVPENDIVNMSKFKTSPTNDIYPKHKYGFNNIYLQKIPYKKED